MALESVKESAFDLIVRILNAAFKQNLEILPRLLDCFGFLEGPPPLNLNAVNSEDPNPPTLTTQNPTKP